MFTHQQICQLLGRSASLEDLSDLGQSFAGKTIWVTGAAGSIGAELARQLVQLNPALVVLIDQAESPLYDLSLELADAGFANFIIELRDICNEARLHQLCDVSPPDCIFHAAAYKHVPLLERHPAEAIRTNILGTKILADLCLARKIPQFVLLSTDKAVEPVSVMGATKRICELYLLALHEHQKNKPATQFIITRFGNVAGSTGSVLPRFATQQQQGGPLMVSHPEVERFFMTPYEACHLVLYAAKMGCGGEVFVFEMGESVRIANLAQALIAAAKKEADIVYTGLRPGEKLQERLFFPEEKVEATNHPSIKKATQQQASYTQFISQVNQLLAEYQTLNAMQIPPMLVKLVPQYVPTSL